MRFIPYAALAFASLQITEAERYGLKKDRTVVETYPRDQNRDADWWVSSGGYFSVSDKVGRTVHGELGEDDRFRGLYSKSNPVDTDGGLRPQNIFRLVTEKRWTSYMQQAYFRVDRVNLSDSPNRNQSNGALLFVGYKDKNHLYYAGVRVDGNAVIKKKMGGIEDYHTLSQAKVFPGEYDRNDPERANLLPLGKWIGMRAFREVNDDGSVRVRLMLDADATGNWKTAAEAVDDGAQFGQPFNEEGQGGIRTDFMDASFHSFAVRDLADKKKKKGKGA